MKVLQKDAYSEIWDKIVVINNNAKHKEILELNGKMNTTNNDFSFCIGDYFNQYMLKINYLEYCLVAFQQYSEMGKLIKYSLMVYIAY